VSYLRAHDFMHFSYEKPHGGGEKGVVDEKVRKIDNIIYYRLIGQGKVGRMTSHACSRHEDKEMCRLINVGEVRGNMREGEGKRD
jgi:hypothetical protein